MSRVFTLIVTIFLNYLLSEDENLSLKEMKLKNQIKSEILSLEEKLKRIESEIESGIWLREYQNHQKYINTQEEFESIEERLNKLSKLRQSKKIKDEIIELEKESKQISTELELLKQFREPPFAKFTKPIQLENIPQVTNPIMVIYGLSYIKQIRQRKTPLNEEYEEFREFIQKLKLKLKTLNSLNIEYKKLDSNKSEAIVEEIKALKKEIDDFELISKLFLATINLNQKKIDEVIQSLTIQIKEQVKQAIYIAIAIAILFIISLIIKLILKKVIQDNDRYYKSNKLINFINFTLIVFILLFVYLENVSYLVTFLGFASAGIAIAMKDLFMSLLGWFVIIIGGTIQVGDRIKVKRDNQEFIGDVLDISPVRITLHEDVTYTTYTLNRRAGRVIFVPNNFIFTSLIANYSHSGLKTVWDGIDITITFDSNHKKAVHLVKEITKRYSKGYTDITRKQLNKLRDKYNLRNTNVEPKVFTFIEQNGVRVSVWYLTNAYATLTLRSTISSDIVDAFKEHSDIVIAYPTQTVNVDSNQNQGEQNSPIPPPLLV